MDCYGTSPIQLPDSFLTPPNSRCTSPAPLDKGFFSLSDSFYQHDSCSGRGTLSLDNGAMLFAPALQQQQCPQVVPDIGLDDQFVFGLSATDFDDMLSLVADEVVDLDDSDSLSSFSSGLYSAPASPGSMEASAGQQVPTAYSAPASPYSALSTKQRIRTQQKIKATPYQRKVPKGRAALAMKRDSHNVTERQRRLDLKHGFEKLRLEIPAVESSPRAHTADILQAAIEYIAELQQLEEELCAEKERLQVEHDSLALQARPSKNFV